MTEQIEQNTLVWMSQSLRVVEERLKEIGSSLAVVAGGQELFFGSVLNLTQEMGQAFAPIVYDDFGLPVDISSPPTNPVGTPEETPLEEELQLTREVEEDEERWRAR